MTGMNIAVLKDRAFAKRNPEFANEIREMDHAYTHAAAMLKAGKLTKREFEDFEAHLYTKVLDELPIDEFHAMMKDGSLEDLERLARHDDSGRDSYGVTEARKNVEKKIKADKLDDAWLEGRIDSAKYAEMNREHVGSNERLNNRLADGDHDGVASEMYAARHDAAPNHANSLTNFLKSKYGYDAKKDGKSEAIVHWKAGEERKESAAPRGQDAELRDWMDKRYGKSRDDHEEAGKHEKPEARVGIRAPDYDDSHGPPVADADGVIDWDNQPSGAAE